MKIGIFLLLTLSAVLSGRAQWYPLVTAVPDNLYGVSFINADTGYACGGTINHALILKTTNAGANWSAYFHSTAFTMYDIAALSHNVAVACGQDGEIIRTTDGGASWIKRPSNVDHWLYDMHFVDQDTGYAVGMEGTLLKTTNAGNTWVVKNTGTSLWLLGVYFLNPKTGFIVGEDGAIRRTDDYGQTWQELNNPDPNFLTSVHFLNTDTGFVVGFQGTLLRTKNGGQTWQKIFPGTVKDLRCIVFYTPNDGYITGDGVIFKTTDGGETWNLTNYPVNVGVEKITIASDQTAFIAGRLGTILKSNITIGLDKDPGFVPLIYPNPAVGEATLSIPSLVGRKGRVTILNITGMMLESNTWDYLPPAISLDFQEYPSGIYLVSVETETQRATVRIHIR